MNHKQVVARLRACADDPMWADHAEVSKPTLRAAIALLEPKAPHRVGNRAAFEAWYLRDHFDVKTSAASLAWSAWQAALRDAALHAAGAAGLLGDSDVLQAPKAA